MTRFGIFDLVDPPTRADVDASREVFAAYAFPWEWTVRRNVRATGQAAIPVLYRDTDSALGYYDRGRVRVTVDPVDVHGVDTFRRTLAHELGHLIDGTTLTHETRREIHALMHDGSDTPLEACPSGDLWRSSVPHSSRPIEAFANLAPHLWCPPYAKGLTRYGPHVFRHADRIGALVMADAETNYPYDDVAGTTHEDAILWATRHGITHGSGGMFRPNDPVTRGQVVAMLRRALEGRAGYPEEGTP